MNLKSLLLLALFAIGCTHNQNERIQELLVSQSGKWNQRKATNNVSDSRKFAPTDLFSLEIVAVDPLVIEKGTFPLYLLKGKTLPLEERLVLAEVDDLAKRTTPLCEFKILETGELTVFYSADGKKEKELIFSHFDRAKIGHPLKYVITSLDTGLYNEVEFYPFPLESSSIEGHKLSLLANHPSSTRFTLYGSGFEPLETITLLHKSGNLDETIYLQADEQGAFSTELIPVEFGKMGGEASVIALHGEDSIALSYPWGSRLEQQSMEKRSLFPIYFVYNTLDSQIEIDAIERSVISRLFN